MNKSLYFGKAWPQLRLSESLKDEAEMRLHCTSKNVYDAHDVYMKHGALVLLRPDGMIGMIVHLVLIQSTD